jgi:excisionase family DNA binding protein
MKEIMDTEDVAELLKVKPLTVRRWLASGVMTGAKIPGAGWRLTPSDIEAWLNKHRAIPQHEAQST